MAKHFKKEPIGFKVTITRTIDVFVPTDSKADAEKVADLLASGMDEDSCYAVNNAMCNGDDELGGISPVFDGRMGFFHMELDAPEVKRLVELEDAW